MAKGWKTGVAVVFAAILIVSTASAAIGLYTHTNTLKKGQLGTFFASIKLALNEKFKVNYMTFRITDSRGRTVETCRFKTDGIKLSGCSKVKYIVPIDEEDHSKWGYHYGAKKLIYKVVVDTKYMKAGNYKAKLSANVKTKTKTKDFSSGSTPFKVVEYKPRIPPKKTK